MYAGVGLNDIVTTSDLATERTLPPRVPFTMTRYPPAGAMPPAAANMPERWPPEASIEYLTGVLTRQSPHTDG